MLETLLANLRAVAPDPVSVSILQPADPFLDTAGEDMRRRIFITETDGGDVKCLRPEFTIPICLAHSANGNSGQMARYAYGGTVFRQAREGGSEFQQVGLEDLGNSDAVLADASCIADMISALDEVKAGDLAITLGDQNLFSLVVENLQLPKAIAARLTRSFGDEQQVSRLIDLLEAETTVTNGSDEISQMAEEGALEPLVAHIEQRMEAANLSPKAGRSPQDIAGRLIEKQRDARFRLDAKHADILRQFLSLRLPLAKAADELEEFAKRHEINWGDGLVAFRNRLNALNERQVSIDAITYVASLGRSLDYYSGLLFEVHIKGTAIGGGGRYDHLFDHLGVGHHVPAVGFSIALDRLQEATS